MRTGEVCSRDTARKQWGGLPYGARKRIHPSSSRVPDWDQENREHSSAAGHTAVQAAAAATEENHPKMWNEVLWNENFRLSRPRMAQKINNLSVGTTHTNAGCRGAWCHPLSPRQKGEEINQRENKLQVGISRITGQGKNFNTHTVYTAQHTHTTNNQHYNASLCECRCSSQFAMILIVRK